MYKSDPQSLPKHKPHLQYEEKTPRNTMPHMSTVDFLIGNSANSIAWFTYARGIHGCMHRPTFESSATASFAPNATPSWEFALLYHAVLAIGACLLGETDRCYQFLKTACNMMMPRMYQSQDLKVVQATYLLVCHVLYFR